MARWKPAYYPLFETQGDVRLLFVLDIKLAVRENIRKFCLPERIQLREPGRAM